VAHQLKGSCAAYFTHFTTCIVELQQALQLYRYNTKMRQVAKLHTMLANFYGMTGHNMLSEHHRTRAITCWEKLHDEWGRIDNIMGLGAIKERQGAYDEAEQLFTQALLLSQGVLRYKCGEAYALTSLGEIYQERDQFQRALVAFEDSLNLARQLDDTYLTCYVFCQLARTHQLMGDAHSALHMLRQLEQSGALPDADGSSSYERAFFALTLGTILLHEGQIHKAAVHLAAAESAFAEVKHEQIQTMIRRAACLLVQERRDTALAQVEKALHLAEAFGYEALVSRELARYPTLLASVKATFPQLWQQFTLPEPIAPPSVSVALPIIPVPTLRIQVLGEPAVFLNETPIRHWRSARAMELFFLLLEAQEPLPKERIVAALWQDEMAPPDQTWRSTLHYLRKILGNTCIVALHGTYALHLTPMYAVQQDSDTFVQTLARAREAQQTGDVEGASQELTTAVHLYQGDYLASLTHEWCLARRRELRQMCISAYQDLAVIAWQCHRVDESLAHWQELLTLDPTSEAAHLGVVRCYLAQGKRPEALRQYQRLVELLQGSFRLDAQLLL
jgi:DNA-binding SARP family transcriptional activator/Tfp pilus assembly protein PilF